jgi:hypothetical protein
VRRVDVVGARGTTQNLAWGSSHYLPAILAEPIAEGLGLSPSAPTASVMFRSPPTPRPLPPPGLPFSLVFRAEPGKEDVVLRIAAAYEADSQRRIPPPAFGPRSSVELTLS